MRQESTLKNIEILLTKVVEELQGIRKSIDEFEHQQISINLTEKTVKEIKDNCSDIEDGESYE